MSVFTTINKTDMLSHELAPLPSILVVEDDHPDFIIAQYHLQQIKVENPIIHVSTATEMFAFLNGDAGYSDRRKYPLPGVIILDVRLPDRSGIEAQAIIRSSLKHRRIPIISISGDQRIALLQQSVDLGANAWMAKPFDPADFLAIVTRLDLPVRLANSQHVSETEPPSCPRPRPLRSE
jgi:CheY-like chemotaxis protein